MDVLKDITDFIFLESKEYNFQEICPTIQKTDAIFVPGSLRPETMEYACELWLKGYAKNIVISGKYSILHKEFNGVLAKEKIYSGNYKTECEFYLDIAKSYHIPEENLILENKATYTMENATYSRKLTDSLGIIIKKGILSCKSFHARRVFMYYKLAYPETDFVIASVDIDNINRENWYLTPKGIENVLGELSRCGSQFTNLIPRYII